MSVTVLHRVDPARNVRRFYALMVAPDLFGGWALVREWGRIGAAGQRRVELYYTEAAARAAGARIAAIRMRRGYVAAVGPART
jgi:predicted DNA-binding WGR domain protein